jgi:zinc protease
MLHRLLIPLLFLLAAPVLAAGDSGWFYRGSDIPPDPAWTFGTLPNGLKYAVRRNALPEGQVSVRLRIDAGSLHEEDEERGWAHFVEHMAFRGTKTYRDGEARETWSRLGASFGSDTNASTQPTQTVYMLDLPKADRESLDTSLKILAEMADSATFDPKLVEAEKGVVLSELGRRAEIGAKLREVTLPLFYGGLKFATRDTIGTEATLKAANAAGLKAFYERWYRPDRATIVMVGDAEPKLMEELIAERFGGWKGEGAPPAESDYGSLAEAKERIASLAYPGSPHLASIAWVRPWRETPDTKAQEREDLAQILAERILNRRFEARARGDSAYLNAGVNASRSRNIAETTQLSVMARDGRWQAAMAEAWAVLADALRAPPSEAEIARELQNLRTSARAFLEADPTRRSPQHAQRLVSAIDSGDVISSAEVQVALVEELAPAMTPAAVGEALKGMFRGSGPRLVMLSPEPLQGLAEALAAAEKAAPAERRGDRRVSMDELPVPGRTGREVSRERIADLDSTVVRFANGSSLVFKKTDFEKGQVGVSVRFGHGLKGLPRDRKPLAFLGPLVGSMGVGPYDLDALERLMTGRRMSIGLSVEDEATVLRGATSARELRDQMRLLAAKMIAPHYDRAVFERWKASALANYDLGFSSAASRFGREFGRFSRGGDPRWRPLEKEEIRGLTFEEVVRFFDPLLGQGPIEVVIVGDVGLEAAVESMLKTVAALPKRPAAKVPAALLAVKPPAPAPAPASFDHSGDRNQAMAAVGWSTFGGFDRRREQRAISVGANLASVRLMERLRDEAGASYSPRVSSTSATEYPGWGFLLASSELRPENAELFFRLAREIVADLAARPVEADEWARTINPVLAGIERRVKTNGYWLGAMEEWSRDARAIETVRNYLSDYRTMTAEEVRRAFAAHVADAGDWSMLVLPAKKPGGVD